MASGQLRLIETAAKSAKRMGLDMIGMEGFTSAGHPGEREEDIGNWVLFPLPKGEDILLTLESRVEEENVLNPGCQRTKDTFCFKRRLWRWETTCSSHRHGSRGNEHGHKVRF